MIERGPPTDETWDGYRSRFPRQTIAVAERLQARLEAYVRAHEPTWTPMQRPNWLGYKRGRFNVVTINLFSTRPVQFAVKLPAGPSQLGLQNPYRLEPWWDERNRQWTWAVPTTAEVPDVGDAVEICREFQPESGPMPAPLTNKAKSVRRRLAS